MPQSKDLIPLENPNPAALFAPGGLSNILERIEKDVLSVVPDMATEKGRKAIGSLALKVSKAKTYLDGMGKDFTAELKRQTGAVDAERRSMRERLDALKLKVRKPLDDWENAEKARVAAIKQKMAPLDEVPNPFLTATEYAAELAAVESVEVDASFQEFRDFAQHSKDLLIAALINLQSEAQVREEMARANREREAQAAAKAQAELENLIAKEAAERATREAQEKVVRAEREKAYAEQRIKDVEANRVRNEAFAAQQAEARQAAAVRAEAQRIEALALAKAEADAARGRDQAHRDRTHNEIVDDLISYALNDRTVAEVLCNAVATGRIRHLKVIY